MSGASQIAEKSDWLKKVFGIGLSGPARAKPASPTAVPVDPAIAPPSRGGVDTLLGHPLSGAPIKGSGVQGETRTFAGANGRKLGITQGADGRVALAAPPPPVQQITFAGGGGKGAALPGAVRALEASGALKDIKVINGASVGSQSGALLAAGATADEFREIANDKGLAPAIMEGRSLPGILLGDGLSGKGLEDLMRSKLDGLVRKRISEYLEATAKSGGQPDPAVLAVLSRLADGTKGPTFGDLRALSKVIPTIKEMSISATYMADIDPDTGKPMEGGRPQLAMFNADTEPDMEVAVAVHASSALPPIFEPVDIKLSSGITARFQDGGVLNNVPTTDSIGDARPLDPIPTEGSIAFVFEEGGGAKDGPLKGLARPEKSAFADWISKAPNSAGNFETYEHLAEKPEDVVVVPLSFTVTDKKGKKGKTKEFTGLLSGTANFDMAMDDRLKLQELSEAATAAHLEKRQQPQTREYASMDQMLMCISADDLAALVADGLEGAKAAQDFRAQVLATIAQLATRTGAMSGKPETEMLQDPQVHGLIETLDALPAGGTDRLGFIARELNRGQLDRLVEAARGSGGGGALAAGALVADSLKAKTHATYILRTLIYPRIIEEDPKGVHGSLLAQIVARLRGATLPEEVNEAIEIAVAHFKRARDLLGRHGYKKFAADLAPYMMPTA
jgi:exoenzyme U